MLVPAYVGQQMELVNNSLLFKNQKLAYAAHVSGSAPMCLSEEEEEDEGVFLRRFSSGMRARSWPAALTSAAALGQKQLDANKNSREQKCPPLCPEALSF